MKVRILDKQQITIRGCQRELEAAKKFLVDHHFSAGDFLVKGDSFIMAGECTKGHAMEFEVGPRQPITQAQLKKAAVELRKKLSKLTPKQRAELVEKSRAGFEQDCAFVAETLGIKPNKSK